MDPETMHVHTANHRNLRKQANYASGGFCEVISFLTSDQ